MAIRRPSINSPTWLFQDFLYQAASAPGVPELRYLQVKWDGEVYTQVSQTFDYSNPPYVGAEQRGGDIVAQIDYEINASTHLVTINSWEVDWRDEWPLRLAVNYISQCLYPTTKGWVTRVVGDQVYNQQGEAINVANTGPYAFWVSEQFNPVTNLPDDYLVRTPLGPGNTVNPLLGSYAVTISPNPAGPGSLLYIEVNTDNVPLGTPLYWKLSGPGINPTFFQSGAMTGKIKVGS